MEDICSLWNYAENVDDVKQKLLYTTLELDAARIELKEQVRKNEANVKHLLGLLKLAYQERDEAKSNLQKLFYKLLPQQLEHETPFLKPKQANNSSITESNNSCFSNSSSPVDSVFDVASSSPPQALVPVAATFNNQQHPIVVDRASMVIDSLVRGKALPEKGRLREAVKQAGDFLHRHVIGVGDLPKWRNPPPVLVLPHFVIAPFSTGGGYSQLGPVKQHGTSCLNSASSSPYDHELMMMSASSGPSSSQFISPPMLSSCTGASGLYTNDRRVSSGLGKRQRMQ